MVPGASAASESVPAPRWHDHLHHWLSAPLLITVVGAVLVNYLIPQITTSAQNHQKALETKTALVREMTDAFTTAVGDSRFVADDVIRKEVAASAGSAAQQRTFDRGLQSWQVASARIGAEIAAYFPAPDLADAWAVYSRELSDLFVLAASGVPDRQQREERLRAYVVAFDRSSSRLDWKALVVTRPKETPAPSDNHFREVYRLVGDALLARGSMLVQQTLRAHLSGL